MISPKNVLASIKWIFSKKRSLLLIFLVVSAFVSFSQEQNYNKNNDNYSQIEESNQNQRYKSLSTEEKHKLLEDTHKSFQFLPFEREYIFNHIFPEIQKEREYIAPNFPTRGETTEESLRNLYFWLENYHEEFEDYIEFLRGKFDYYNDDSFKKRK